MPADGQYSDSASRVNRADLTEEPKKTAAVIRELRAGYGFEDIQVRGVASADYARAVARRLTCMGLIHDIYRQRRAK